jgi:hypothetical protein
LFPLALEILSIRNVIKCRTFLNPRLIISSTVRPTAQELLLKKVRYREACSQ